MSRRTLCIAVAAYLIATLGAGHARGVPARRESVLAWDQADSADCLTAISYFAGQRLAVGFVAPPWARSVTRVELFIAHACIAWPQPIPPPPEVCPFDAYVWAPSATDPYEPGELASSPVNPGWDYPAAAWMDLSFPGGVSIENPEIFPGGRFYVGIEYLHRLLPYIGLDVSDPDNMTQSYDWSEWSTMTDGDAMIRAVVSDQPGTGVEASSWGRVKALYR